MKAQILLISLFAFIQTFAQNDRHESAGAGCTSPTGVRVSDITRSNATISWNPVSGATSYNLAYESSGAWINVFVPGISYTLTGLAPNTTYGYHVLAVCSGSYSEFSQQSYFTTKGNLYNCLSKGNSTAHEFINKVRFGAINNLSGDNGGYKNYTALSTNLTAGQVCNIRLIPGFHGLANKQYWTVYIDYNHNSSFADAGERVFTGSSLTVLSGLVTMPSSFTSGVARMRVQMHYGSFIINPCATFDYGEVEDYTVNLLSNGGFTDFKEADNAVGADNTRSATISVSPNPVHGSNAIVTYHIADAGSVTLTIIDVNGRAARALDLGLQSAGVHSYHLNHIDDLSGNYFIKIEQENKLIGKAKIVVLH